MADTLTISPSTVKASKRKGKAKPRSHRRASFSVVEQVRTTFSRAHRLSALIGFALGGFVPLAVYTLVHDVRGVSAHPALWVMVVGGLGYSAPKVWRWGTQAFGGTFLSAFYVVLVEGMVTFAPIPWLAHAGLIVLIGINGIAAASSLQARTPAPVA